MVVYRDCQSAGGALFDSAPGTSLDGTVTVYRGDSKVPYIETITLDAPEISRVSPDGTNPCLVIPPNVCVEKGVYTFEVELPLSDFSYHVVYQRCCRNFSISNILEPGQTGATYTTEVTPLAQRDCNSSIRFKNFPPIVICQGAPLDFDHSAIDPDEDSSSYIEYEFCAPYDGGGIAGSTTAGDPEGFNGVAPNPDAPPPYAVVEFLGLFSSSEPLGGDPVITIDPQTGIITGTPTMLGQYVVGVCATEYDSSGNIISIIRRDFQFNVAECDRRVFAEIAADSVVNGAFVVNSCGRTSVNFINRSYQEEFIESYRWTFDINGEIKNYTNRNPTVTFPGLGTYTGTMYLNEGTICADTAEVLVNILGGVTNSFTYDYDTCVAGPISLRGEDSTGNSMIIERLWNFGNAEETMGQDVSYEYLTPGIKRIQYLVTDDEGCTSVAVRDIPYYPIPNEIIITPVFGDQCVPVTVFFENLSYPLDEDYDIQWEFGDGGSSNEISPTHIYENPGNYEVQLSIVSPIGCEYEGSLDQEVVTIPSPTAGFTYSPQELNQFNKEVDFIDQSEGANQWRWLFPSDQESTLQNPSFMFPDTGRYEITQIVTHPNGCKDTLTKILDIIPLATYFLPNAFTPNNDGRNDRFLGAGDLLGVDDFEMQIFNRWGELIFQTNDPNEGWNGRKNNSGLLLPKDVYVVRVSYTGPRGEKVELKGFATLIQ